MKSTKSIMDKEKPDQPFINCELCGQLQYAYMIIKGICVNCKEDIKRGKEKKELTVSREDMDKIWEFLKENNDEEDIQEVFDIMNKMYKDNELGSPSEDYDVTVTVTSVQKQTYPIKSSNGYEASSLLLDSLRKGETRCPSKCDNAEISYVINKVERI